MTARVPSAVRDALEVFARRVREELADDVFALRLFGSFARGDATAGSDIDVLVLLRDVDGARKRRVLDIAGDVWIDTGLLVAPVVMAISLYETWRRQERPLVMAIEREGAPL